MILSGSFARSRAFDLEEFRRFASLMVFDDGETREPEGWQLEYAGDVLARAGGGSGPANREAWLIVPEGNGKSTFLAQLGLYGLYCCVEPWIPVGAASRDQAEIIYGQAAGFIRRTPELKPHFRAFDGYRKITCPANGGRGLKVYPHDPKTGDGVIPFPFALVDEPHRHPDMRLYGLWKGKLRKRRAQILVISTAGEPGTEFEDMREKIRAQVVERHRDGAFLRALGDGLALHEYMVQADEDCSDMEAVKAANPLSSISVADLAAEYGSPTLDIGEWKRFKCNRPARSAQVAISDAEWDDAEVAEGIPAGASIDVGLDVAFKWDTTALVPLWKRGDLAPWKAPKYRLLGPATILTPPRDGSSMHPDVIKDALLELAHEYRVESVVMDMSRAEDIAAWIEDDLQVEVIDRGQSNQFACADYEAVMDGLRNGTLKHTGDRGLRSHVMNAVARRLPGGDYRFDRPTTTRSNAKAQDRRVIDALTATGMVVDHSNLMPKRRSAYEDRYAAA
jgi:phage terminase large subunit-like protein